MRVIRETTNWDLPGHTYALQGERMVAYRVKSTGEIRVFSKPLRFERSRRRFETVRDDEVLAQFQEALS